MITFHQTFVTENHEAPSVLDVNALELHKEIKKADRIIELITSFPIVGVKAFESALESCDQKLHRLSEIVLLYIIASHFSPDVFRHPNRN